MPRQKELPSGMRQRGKAYYAWFRTNGRSVQKRLSTDYRTACQLLNELRARADRGDFGLLDNAVQLADIEKAWLRSCGQTLRPSTVKRYRENLANLKALPAKTAAQVSHNGAVAYREKRLAEGASTRTVNMEVTALSTMLAWAVKADMIGSNPLEGLDPLPQDERTKERRALTVDEVQQIFDASPAYLLPVFRMLLTTGIRLDELVEMRFADVDHERRTATVRSGTAKNHEEREIPLDDDLLATIATLEAEAANRQPDHRGPAHVVPGKLARFTREHVFVTGSNTPWTHHLLERFYAVCKVAGIEGAEPGGSIDIHALRGSFITLAIDHGANPKAVQGIVGHKSERMTMGVYAKATEQGKRAAVSALPFAKATAPKHVVSLRNADTARTSVAESSQSKTA